MGQIAGSGPEKSQSVGFKACSLTDASVGRGLEGSLRPFLSQIKINTLLTMSAFV